MDYIKDRFRDWHRKITIVWQSLSVLSKVLILIPFTITIPFLLALTFSILLTLVFVIYGSALYDRWLEILGDDRRFNIDDIMKVPTFYSMENDDGVRLGLAVFFPVVGVIFGGIHCAGWFFIFPSSAEAMLWRVSSAVLTIGAVLLPIVTLLIATIFSFFDLEQSQFDRFVVPIAAILLLAYVVSRLLLLVEAFISLRHLTPGMLALVKWTSFIPHI